MLGWILVKIKCKCKLFGEENKIKKKYFEKKGMKIGEGCCIFSDISTPESYLITVGNNVTISNDVQFLTHDNSIDRVATDKCDIFGCINIGDNVFIGARAIILPGVTVASNVIIGAGSVVTKSVPSGMIVGGNPARIIGTTDAFLKKYHDVAFGSEWLAVGKKPYIEQNIDKVLKDR